jgi:isochorismate synthase
MNADLLHQRFNEALDAGCNFAAVRLPGAHDVFFFYAQQHAAMRRIEYNEPGNPVFLYSPYGAGNKAYTLVSDAVYKNDECIFGSLPSGNQNQHASWHTGSSDTNYFADESFYTGYVNKIVSGINKDKFDKVVAARCERVLFDKSIDAASLFDAACKKYPDAYIFFFSTRDAGTWFGASPEKLLSLKGNTIETIALAGTLPADADDNWTDKEYDEQGMISFFIDQAFTNHGFKQVNEEGPETLVAGNVKHLCTKFTAIAPAAHLESKLHKFLGELNPTPAVCGLPQFEASLFIAEHEKMERRFYSGFTGIRLPGHQMDLYVNLRCAELFDNHALLYAGAGITAESNAEKEWGETQRKISTIGSILE